MHISTTCKKCGTKLIIDFGLYTKEEALQYIERLDGQSRECPGQHTEFGGWRQYWDLDDAVRRAYDLGQGITDTLQDQMSDEEFARELMLMNPGCDVLCFGGGIVAAEGRAILDFGKEKHLRHLGFGTFENDSATFLRNDAPSGKRFYVKVKR